MPADKAPPPLPLYSAVHARGGPFYPEALSLVMALKQWGLGLSLEYTVGPVQFIFHFDEVLFI
jgi:hypothetical protein